MVDLALLQSVSYIAGALGVCVAAIYYVMNLQMTRRKIKIDNTILYGNLLTDKERVKQWHHVLFEQQFSSYEEWAKKYRSDPEAFSNFYATQGFMSMVGMCIKEGVVDREMLFKRGFNVWVKLLYPKILPWIMGMRTRYNDPEWGSYHEYFYNEVMRMYPDISVPNDLKDLFVTQ